VQRVLAAAGHQVHTARDGAEAVAIAAANHSIDVALVDLTMPRLAGPSLIAALRAELPKAPVLVMTGYASDEMIAALEKAGVYAVLKKPVPAAMLLDSIAAALAGGSTG
jgi:two-component system sensor histidine kinase RpfC